MAASACFLPLTLLFNITQFLQTGPCEHCNAASLAQNSQNDLITGYASKERPSSSLVSGLGIHTIGDKPHSM